MAVINWDFAVSRHVATLTRIAFEEGKEIAQQRAHNLQLPDAFRRRVIDAIKGEDTNGLPY
jgi:hypothetical protein